MTATYIYLGYGVTDSNGKAKLEYDAQGNPLTHSYTGTGAGKVDIVASLDSEITGSSLVSETYSLMDCLFYQDGTTEPPSNTWVLNKFTPTYGSDGTTLTSTEFATCFANKKGTSTTVFDWDSPVSIEFYITNITSTNADIQIYDNTNNCTRSFNVLGITGNNQVKILVESDKIRYFVDGVEKTPQQWNVSVDTFRVGLRGTGTITFKDFMIYPI